MENKINLAFPVNMFDSIRELLTPEHIMEEKSETSNMAGPETTSALGYVMVDTVLELGRAKVSLHDVMNIGVGDVIRLDKAVDDPLDVTVQGTTKLYGRPGLVGNKMAVQIMDQAVEQPSDLNAELVEEENKNANLSSEDENITFGEHTFLGG
jgi:flagellar motor switch protein FliM